MCGPCIGWRKHHHTPLAESNPCAARFMCSTCSANNLSCPTCGAVTWHYRAENRWNQTLQLHVARLGKYAASIDSQLTYQAFNIFLKGLERIGSAGHTIQLLSPKTVDHVHQFTSAINSITQANAFACMMWGTMQAVLKVAYSYSYIVQDIIEMLSEITTKLPIFEEYQTVLQTALELEEPLRELYDDYVNFCINVVLFFKSKRWTVFRKLAYGSIRHDFQETKANIVKHTSQFHSKIDFAQARLGVAVDEHILKLTETNTDRLPEVKGVPFQRNPRFMGRDKVLDDLHQHLKSPMSAQEMKQRVCVIHGLGGVGKTQTALEYTYRYRYAYSHILWVKAESDALIASYGNLAQELAPSLAGVDQVRNADIVHDWLMKNDSWLLILDNVNTANLSKYWPPSSRGAIIITTQLQSVAHQATLPIELDTFNDEVGSKLILDLIDPSRQSTTSEDAKTAKTISKELGGLPILLSHVAGFIGGSKCPLKDLLQNLQRPSTFMKIWAYDSTTSTNFQYGEPMEKVWKLALEILTPEALTTLHIMAFLNADGIQEDALIGRWNSPELSFLSPERILDFNQIKQSLVDRHLVTATSVGGRLVLSIHRSLKQHLLHRVNQTGKDKLQLVFKYVLEIVQHSWPPADELQAPRAESWRECELCLPHILSLVSIFSSWTPSIEGSQRWAKMLADTVVYMWERGLSDDCLKLIEIGEQVCDHLNNVGEVAVIHADLCTVSAGLAQDSGYRGRELSIKQCQKSLQLRQKQVDELEEQNNLGRTDVLRLANAWNDLGVAMIHDGDFEDATPHLVKSLGLKQLWADEQSLPWHFGETYKNLAFVSLAQEHFDEAKAYARRATELCSRNLPEESAAVQKARYIEGLVLMNCGERDTALRIHKKVLLARSKILGESNPFTRDSAYIVGDLYRLKGKFDKAEAKYKMALGISGIPLENGDMAPENSDNWTKEARARAKHRLALVIRQSADVSDKRAAEAQRLETEARNARAVYLQTTSGVSGSVNEFQIHDMMVSLWAGRMNIIAPSSAKDLKATHQTR